MIAIVATGCFKVDTPHFTEPVDAAADETPPEIVSTTPEGGATEISTATVIAVEFSEPIELTSATDSSFRILDPTGVPVGGTRSVDGNILSFSSPARLDPSVAYSVEITVDIQDLAGNQLVEPLEFLFETVGRWAAPALIENDGSTTIEELDAAMNGGRGVVAWVTRGCSTSCTGDYALFASVYENGTFGPPSLIANSGTTLLPDPRVAIDPMGNATVVWGQRIGTHTSLHASRRPAGGSWSSPSLIETEELGSVGVFALAADSAGSVFAVWEQNDATTNNAWVNRYAIPGGWTGATRLEQLSDAVSHPSIAVSGGGAATAVWSQSGSIRYARYTGTWTSAANAVAGQTGFTPMMTVLDDDSVMMLWDEGDDIGASHYIGGWSNSEVIDDSADFTSPPKITYLSGGEALAIWYQGALGQESLYSARFDGDAWSAAGLIETLTFIALSPTISTGQDRAMAAWTQRSDGIDSVWTQEYRPSEGWRGPVLAEADQAQAADGIVLYDESLNVFVCVWKQGTSGVYSLYWNHFD